MPVIKMRTKPGMTVRDVKNILLNKLKIDDSPDNFVFCD